MTSQDNQQQYLTVEMFNAKIDAFIATIRLENEKLRNELHNEIQSAKTELNSKINTVNSQIDNFKTEIKGEIQTINTRIDGMNDRITDLQSSISSYFMIATLFITFLTMLTGVLIAFAPRIWAFLERKSKSAVTEEKESRKFIHIIRG